jgi:hypothetical protein
MGGRLLFDLITAYTPHLDSQRSLKIESTCTSEWDQHFWGRIPTWRTRFLWRPNCETVDLLKICNFPCRVGWKSWLVTKSARHHHNSFTFCCSLCPASLPRYRRYSSMGSGVFGVNVAWMLVMNWWMRDFPHPENYRWDICWLAWGWDGDGFKHEASNEGFLFFLFAYR